MQSGGNLESQAHSFSLFCILADTQCPLSEQLRTKTLLMPHNLCWGFMSQCLELQSLTTLNPLLFISSSLLNNLKGYQFSDWTYNPLTGLCGIKEEIGWHTVYENSFFKNQIKYIFKKVKVKVLRVLFLQFFSIYLKLL